MKDRNPSSLLGATVLTFFLISFGLVQAVPASPQSGSVPGPPQSASTQARERLLEELRTQGVATISGRLQKSHDLSAARYQLRASHPGMNLPAASGLPIPEIFLDFDLSVQLRWREDGAWIQSYNLQAVSEWERWIETQDPNSTLPVETGRVGESLKQLAKRFRTLTQNPSEGLAEAFTQQLADSRSRLATAYAALFDRALSGEPVSEEFQAWMDKLVELFKLLIGPGSYGANDNYPVPTYRSIYRNSQGVGQLRDAGTTGRLCSGVLIGKNLFLTDDHCIVRHEDLPGRLEVWFDEITIEGRTIPAAAFPVEQVLWRGAHPKDPLDFAVLLLGKRDQKAPGDLFKPRCLLPAPFQLPAEPLYLIGYPRYRQPKTVHDNTRILFPFRLEQEMMHQLRIRFAAELDQDSDRERKVDETLRDYEKKEFKGQTVWERRLNGRPAIGVNSDTYKINSGSPAFLKERHLIIGLLRAGHLHFYENPENIELIEASARQSETLLPISEIVARIDEIHPNWFKEYGVCLVSPNSPAPAGL